MTKLSDLLAILSATRMDAVCDRWHLNERVTPSLEAMAGGGLRQAAKHTTAADEHLNAAADELRKAIALVEECVPVPPHAGSCQPGPVPRPDR